MYHKLMTRVKIRGNKRNTLSTVCLEPQKKTPNVVFFSSTLSWTWRFFVLLTSRHQYGKPVAVQENYLVHLSPFHRVDFCPAFMCDNTQFFVVSFDLFLGHYYHDYIESFIDSSGDGHFEDTRYVVSTAHNCGHIWSELMVASGHCVCHWRPQLALWRAPEFKALNIFHSLHQAFPL